PSAPEIPRYQEDSALDIVEEGMKTALVCISEPSRAEVVEQAVSQMGYYVVSAGQAALAMRKLRHNRYDVVVLDECYGGAKASDNLVLHHIQFLPMHVRREFFLCLLSETMTTLDAMAAFRKCVDMIVNIQDLDKFKIALSRAMKEHSVFYGIFRDELNKKG
ncbi:MAG: hypothetical protein ACLGPL_07350, partial [Acidobacteriota bacterium]